MTTTSDGRARTWRSGLVAGLVAVVAGLVSVGRLLLATPDAMSTMVWAEDGLFPLCVRAHNVFSCLVDPYSGYLLFLPRIIAWPVSVFPLDDWPLITNLAAALVAAVGAGITVVVLRAGGVGWVCSGLVALLPVAVPLTGFEAINVAASSYMILIFLATLAISLPPWQRRFPTITYAVGALVVALTIPSSVVLVLPLTVQMVRRRVALRSGLIVSTALCGGLLAQAIVALTAENGRKLEFTWTAVGQWVDSMPIALATHWPGSNVTLAVAGDFNPMPWSSHWLGLATVAVVAVSGVVLVVRSGYVSNALGLLLLSGLALGLIPASIGFANNRYYVIPLLLWTAAAAIGLDRVVPGRWRELVMAAVVVGLAACWWGGFKASDRRSTVFPVWSDMLGQARAACIAQSDATIPITFSPGWPFVDAVFPGPTNNVVACSVLGP